MHIFLITITHFKADHFSQRLAECIISLRAEIWAHRSSLTVPLVVFFVVPVPNNSISGIDFPSFSAIFPNGFEIVPKI